MREEVNGYVVSVAFDDSCGAMQNLGRSDIRVYDANDRDVTERVFGSDAVVIGTIDNLIIAYNWCKAH
jgi:hypothetical protein